MFFDGVALHFSKDSIGLRMSYAVQRGTKSMCC